jgi:hypothetical protein
LNLEEKVARLQVLIDTAPEERGSDFAARFAPRSHGSVSNRTCQTFSGLS